MKRYLINCILIIILWVSLSPFSFAFDRRKPQFLDEPSYLILPLPWSIPGIGSGIMLTGLVGNIGETNMDIFALKVFGDAEGNIIGIDELFIYPETIYINAFYQDLSKAVVQNFEKRGMDTEKDEFNYIELDKVLSKSASVTLTLFDRRLELFGTTESQEIRIPRIRDSKGNIISEFSPSYESESRSTSYGATIDYTDDRQDARKGVRLTSLMKSTPADSERDPEFYTINNSLSFFIPIGEISTIAMNYFASDAHVSRHGETDETMIKQQLGFNCDSNDQACLEAELEILDMFVSMRKYGTSSSLGGDTRMRAYPQGRFSGAHTRYYGIEYRWNIAEDVVPFDFWVWQDVASGFQLSLFYENGAVEDLEDDLSENSRSDYGIGFRMVSASGYVYRADWAVGDEGAALSMMFNYPW
jgi:hypothetical protein